MPRAAGRGDAWAEEAARAGRRSSQRIVEVRELEPPPGVADALDLRSGDPVVVRRRIMYVDNRPVELTDSYYPAALARGTRLAETRKIPGGAVTLLAELGHAIHEVSEDVTVDLPDAERRGALALGEGEPVLLLTRTGFAADRRPVEVSVMTMPRGSHLRYRIGVG
ncbi:GntR family transcriptional regulator [Streptomyces phytophilus]|uniref:GntR family transcriptional regulator n=1 Tax=Streptomyces phytophilus TaxID=722715 RepID=UPI002867F012|nr:UTRA domain-containing protein [Streptomyces phytophilus]